jgi:small subunit ribosomal protein S7
MKKLSIKKKLLNHLMKNGEKKTSEKIFLQSLKEIQKTSLKQTKSLVKTALINTAPIFKLHTIKNKKQKKKNRKIKTVPFFIYNNLARISLAIKFIIDTVAKRKTTKFFIKLNEEILLSSKQQSETIQMKDYIQKKVFAHKRYFKFFRWNK